MIRRCKGSFLDGIVTNFRSNGNQMTWCPEVWICSLFSPCRIDRPSACRWNRSSILHIIKFSEIDTVYTKLLSFSPEPIQLSQRTKGRSLSRICFHPQCHGHHSSHSRAHGIEYYRHNYQVLHRTSKSLARATCRYKTMRLQPVSVVSQIERARLDASTTHPKQTVLLLPFRF